ncbi:MAG: hypothetical protein KKF89_00890 [Nanoarchaeota archaeon]|nr:hypothetical protein [Nanoarchaeota archaeon]
MIVDWKTSKRPDDAGKYRQQLEIYKRVLSLKENIPIEKIKVAIGFVGLKKRINDGEINKEYDKKQPAGTAFATIKKRMDLLLRWRSNVEDYFEDLKEVKSEEPLFKALMEEISR